MQFRGARQRADGWYELGLFVAWHSALFQRAKTLPELAPLLKKIRQAGTTAKAPEARQTWQEQKGIMAGIRALAVKAPPIKPRGERETKTLARRGSTGGSTSSRTAGAETGTSKGKR